VQARGPSLWRRFWCALSFGHSWAHLGTQNKRRTVWSNGTFLPEDWKSFDWWCLECGHAVPAKAIQLLKQEYAKRRAQVIADQARQRLQDQLNDLSARYAEGSGELSLVDVHESKK